MLDTHGGFEVDGPAKKELVHTSENDFLQQGKLLFSLQKTCENIQLMMVVSCQALGRFEAQLEWDSYCS